MRLGEFSDGMMNLFTWRALLVYAAIWLAFTSVLGVLTGWFFLARRFPDRPAPGGETIRYRSGFLGPCVPLLGLLHFHPCKAGFRLSIHRLFGPFFRPVFVPWEEATLTRWSFLFFPLTTIDLGAYGRLTIPSRLMDCLLSAAQLQVEIPPAATETRWSRVGHMTLALLLTYVVLPVFAVFLPFLFVPMEIGGPQFGTLIFIPACLFALSPLLLFIMERD